MGHALAQDQTESRVTCYHKHVLKILVSLTGVVYISCCVLGILAWLPEPVCNIQDSRYFIVLT